jgi:hypothetical protein
MRNARGRLRPQFMKEESMLLRRMGIGAALLAAGALFGASAQAAPVSGARNTKQLIDPQAVVEKAQVFVWSGRRYCFYWDAWNGPGWYYCGYAWRRGYGWGGGPGWHGWHHHGRAWHRRNRGWDRTERRRPRIERGERRGPSVGRSGRPERGVRSGRSRPDGASPRSGRSGGGSGMSSGRSGGGSGMSSGGRGGGGGGGASSSGGRGGRS